MILTGWTIGLVKRRELMLPLRVRKVSSDYWKFELRLKGQVGLC